MSRREHEPVTPEAERELAAIDAVLRGEAVDPEWAETAEMALLLQVDRPRPRAEFVAGLDARAASRFAKRPARTRRSWSWKPSLRPALALAACLLVAIVVVTGVLTRPKSSAELATGARPSSAATAATARGAQAAKPGAQRFVQRSGGTEVVPAIGAQQYSRRADGLEELSGHSTPLAATTGSRQVERTSSLTLGVAPAKLQDTSRQVFDVAARLFHGYVLSSSVASGDGSAGGATFQLKIPSGSVSEAEGRLARLGHVRSQTDTTQDISSAFVSADRRLADASAERRGLLRALARASTPNQTSSIRRRLQLVEGEIAGAERDVRSLRKRADLTSVSLTIVPETHGAIVPGRDHGLTPGGALHSAGRILSVALSVLLIVLAIALPFALLAGLGLAGTRALRRRRREAALGAA